MDSGPWKFPQKQKSCATHCCRLYGATARGILETKRNGGEKMDIQEMKKDIVEYDLYYVVDSIPYGDYQLSILNEGDKIIIVVYDDQGSASYAMDKEEFLNINTTEELKKHINNILYYNYNEHDGE
jgi:hypothetical protein